MSPKATRTLGLIFLLQSVGLVRCLTTRIQQLTGWFQGPEIPVLYLSIRPSPKPLATTNPSCAFPRCCMAGLMQQGH